MELAVQATQACEFKDWFWKVQLAKCYVALNLVRDAEQQLRSAAKQQYHVETFVRLARVYQKLGRFKKILLGKFWTRKLYLRSVKVLTVIF